MLHMAVINRSKGKETKPDVYPPPKKKNLKEEGEETKSSISERKIIRFLKQQKPPQVNVNTFEQN